MTRKETLDKAYGNVPKDIPDPFDFLDVFDNMFRGLRFRYFKIKRFFTR